MRQGRAGRRRAFRPDIAQSDDVVRGRAFCQCQFQEAKSSKVRASPGKENQRKSLGFPWILFAESSLFNRLYRPLGRKFFFFSFPSLSAFPATRLCLFASKAKVSRLLIFRKEYSAVANEGGFFSGGQGQPVDDRRPLERPKKHGGRD
jgi:hypothetical protein